MKQKKILLIEDEKDISDVVKIQLELQGHLVYAIPNGKDAIELIGQNDFDLYIIDRLLPGMSGIEICEFIRSNKKTLRHPILFLTALTTTQNIIEGLEAGADDYMTKPFEMQVLIARTNALLRRYAHFNELEEKNKVETEISLGELKVNFDSCQTTVAGEKINLTASEFKILSLLLKNAGKVLSRKELVQNIQGKNIHVTERTIDTHMAGLRKKIGVAATIIETIRGIGYRVSTDEF